MTLDSQEDNNLEKENKKQKQSKKYQLKQINLDMGLYPT